MKYWSQEWAGGVKTKSSDAEYLKKMKGFTVTVHTMVLDCPDGKDRLGEWEFKDGKIISVRMSEEATGGSVRSSAYDAQKVLFRGVADYETWCKLHKGEITAAQGMTGGVFKIEGDMVKVMPKMGGVAAFNDLMSAVPAEY